MPFFLAALCCLLVARPLFPSETAALQGDGMPVVMLWLVLAVAWLVRIAVGRGEPLRLGKIDAAVLALTGLHTLAGLYAVWHDSPRPAVNTTWEWIGLAVGFLLVRQLVRTGREARAVVAVMVALSCGIAAHGLYQYGVELPKLRAAYAADPDRALREEGIDAPAGSPRREVIESRLLSPEPLGTFALTNSLAAMLAPWLIVGAGIAMANRENRRRMAVVIVCLLPMAACLALTKSRSAFVAVAVGLVLLWLRRFGWKGCHWRLASAKPGHWQDASGTQPETNAGPNIWKCLAAAVLLAMILAGGAAMTTAGRNAMARAATSLGYRFHYWQATARLIADHPLAGCGPGNFQHAYTQYKLPEADEEVADPHDFLLEIWATAGTPAMLAFLAVLGLVAWRSTGRVGRRAPTRSVGLRAPPTSSIFHVFSWWGSLRSTHPTTTTRETDDQSAVEKRPLGNLPCAFVGLLGGFLLAVPLGLICAAPPGITAVLVGLPVALVGYAMLSGWVREGWLPAELPGVGIAVLLVNLLTTGGIGLPSIAGTFWLLVALAMREDEAPRIPLAPREAPSDDPCATVLPNGTSSSTSRGARGIREASRRARAVRFAALAIVFALTVACFATGYDPVLRCQQSIHAAWAGLLEGNAVRATRDLEQAVAADPLSFEAPSYLAALSLEDWLRQPEAAKYERLEQCDAAARHLAPQASAVWLASGDRYLRAFFKTDAAGRPIQPGAIEKARESYRRAVELYPNSGIYHARLATASHAAGDDVVCRREAQAALDLDDRTPHASKRLPAAVRREMKSMASKDSMR